MAASSSKYYNDVRSGSVFIGSTAAAGTALPISTGTAVTCGLWNSSSGKNAVLLNATLGFTSGTIALGEFGLANQFVGYAIGTAAPLTAFTGGTPKNALVGNGNASSMQFTPSGATLTAGGTALYWFGEAVESATAGTGVFACNINLDGMIIVPPGNLVFLCGSIAQTALFTCSLTWAEVPV